VEPARERAGRRHDVGRRAGLRRQARRRHCTTCRACVALSAVLGVLLAIVIVWNDMLLRTGMPVLILFNTLPKIALAPLFIVRDSTAPRCSRPCRRSSSCACQARLRWIEPELMQKTIDITFASNKPDKPLVLNDVFTNQFSSKVKP
jgi:hypothetical protein